MKSSEDITLISENHNYFKALKCFLSCIHEDTYVNQSGLTDILIEYILSGEAREDIINNARLVIETTDDFQLDFFKEALMEFSPSLMQPLREMFQTRFPQITRDYYTINQIRVVPSTETIIMRLHHHETYLHSRFRPLNSGHRRKTI